MIDQLLDAMLRDAIANDATATERDHKMLNITETKGQFLDLMVRECHPQRILEIGTSNGYSAIWLARAAAEYNGRVVTLDFQAWKTELARKNLQSAELSQQVELHAFDASDFLSKGSPYDFDFIFLDADRQQYAKWASSQFLAVRFGTSVADIATSHPAKIVYLRAFVDHYSDLDSIVLPIGNGQLVFRKRSDEQS